MFELTPAFPLSILYSGNASHISSCLVHHSQLLLLVQILERTLQYPTKLAH